MDNGHTARQDETKFYLIGGGIASLAAAAFLIRDTDTPGRNIVILEQLDRLGGSLDGAEAKNRADAMVYNVEKTLKEHRSKIGEAGAKEIESALEETKKAIGENDPARINSAVDRLTAASHKLAEAMYKSDSAQSGAQTPPPSAGDQGKNDAGKDSVVDAEFVDVGH